MLSEQKIQANKLNALKSTGPCTPEGRAKSALNAIKHGLCAQTVIISSENSDEFRVFAKNLTTDFAPINQVERNMVKRIVSLSWAYRQPLMASRACHQIRVISPRQNPQSPIRSRHPEQRNEPK